jgi:hypothetical protein
MIRIAGFDENTERLLVDFQGNASIVTRHVHGTNNLRTEMPPIFKISG